MHYIIDLITIGIITGAVLIGKRKGFLKSSYNVLSFVITAILVVSLQDPFCDFLAQSTLGENIRLSVFEQVTGKAEENQEAFTESEDVSSVSQIGEEMGLPDFMMKFFDEKLEEQTQAVETIKNSALATLADAVTELILKIISILLLFVIVRISVFLLLQILGALFKLPVLKSINSVLGILIGTVNGLIVIYIVCAVITLLIPSDSLGVVVEMIDSTLLTKYFYNNNLLIEIFI